MTHKYDDENARFIPYVMRKGRASYPSIFSLNNEHEIGF